MKDNLLDGHRGKVAANVTTTPTGSGKTEVVGGPGPTNFDDDYNEWELGIGDLIIDLDADIEKNNDKFHGLGGGEGSVTFGLLTQQSCDLTTTSSMSNSKQCRMTGNSNTNSSSGGGASSTGTTGTVEHQATVDKGLKMKIKRKNVGSKFSEAKHEIVQSDTKVAHQTPTEVGATSNCTPNNQQAESKSKHSSGKGRSTSHREKKEKNKDKGTSSKATAEVNGVVNSAHNMVSASIKLTNNGNGASSGNSSNSNSSNGNNNNAASSTPPAPSTPLPPAQTPTTFCEANNNAVTTTNCLPSILPSLTVKLETKYSSLPANSTVLLKPEDLPKSPPPKRARMDKADPMRDAGTSTSVGTITEPECLGPCEPGTSVTLEGIVWQETEGGVLVVNVTWRGKTYVGTLLDCTKHDWAPPRFCESPTSDIDAKTSKARGKRGRASTGTASEVNNYNESRATVQSKLRNCKGRRSTSNSSNSTNSGFTVPSSPAKSDTGTCSNGKRKGRPADLELNVTPVDNKGSKRSRSQARSTPTPNNNSLTDFTQPSSPVLIECPEPNCSKKYKHINGLRYHQTHAHSNSEAGKIEDMLEDGKDTTNSSDNDESIQDSGSVSPSPAITTFPSSVSPHSHDSNNRTISAPESLNILDMSTPAEGESYSEATDLSTLASVAISDSKKNNAFVHLTTTSNTSPSTVIKSQENGETSTNSETTKPICVNIPIAGAPTNLSSHVGLTATSPVPLSSPSLTNYATSASSSSGVPSVTASIPTSHVLFNQTCTVGSSTVSTAGSLMNLTSTATMSAMCSVQSNNITTFFTPSVPSTGSSLPSTSDKSKLEKADKYKIKSSGTAIVRSVIPVPPAQVLSTSNAPQPSSTSHSHVTSSLKPIQPKPTILGEPTTINPALESLKKEKSKHKKKNKERDKDRKGCAILQPTKSQILSNTEESERLGRSTFENLDSALTKTITNTTGISPSQQKPIVASLGNSQSVSSNSDSNAADSSNINENVQSPAYSDISDANDSAPVLESEVPSNKDKDEVKSPPEVASQTAAAASLSTYGMYSYYSNPPYLIPSVPQNSVPPSTLNVEKNDSEKKSEGDRSKEVRNWNCQPSEVKMENNNVSQEKTGKKTPSEEVQASSNISSAVASSGSGQQEYPMQQQYAYPYGYMQGYPYSAVDATYHMHLLTTDPHYKQQCDQYMEEQERLYREQAERQKEHVERQHKEHIEKQHKEQERQHKEQERQHKEQERQHKEQERHHKEQQERHHKEQDRHHKEQDRHHKEQERQHKEQERQHKEQERQHKEQERQHKEQERQHKEHSEKHHKDQSERQHKEHIERQHKDPAERHKLHIQHSQMRSKDDRNREKITEEKGMHSSLSGSSIPSDLSKQANVGSTVIATKDREIRPPSHPSQSRSESSTTPSISPVVSTSTPLKEKQNENHQILKENIELKSQMDTGKVKLAHYESAMLYDRQHEMRRFYMMQEGLVDPHQKSEREHSQQQQQPLQGRKEEMFGTVVMKNKSCAESTRPTSVILSPKSDSAKSLSSSSSSSSPKGTSRESSLFSKDYSNSVSSKKEAMSSAKTTEHSESSSREEKHKSDKAKAHAEGQKPTMETTGPPPPPTNSYAYIQPSYIQPSHLQPTHLQPTHLQSSHPHFAHIPFDSIYRGSLSPMLMSASPHYGGSHFIHPQLRYHVPSAPCEIPPHSQAVSDSLGSKLHAPTQAKALDLLHQVSQHYTCTSHKIHELHERALMSPNSSTAPSAAQGSSQSKVSSNEPTANSSKQEPICLNERSQSPPPQRHLHTHHHTHVGVGYPLYDPYGATHPHWKQAQNQRRVSYRLTDQCDLIGKKPKEQEVP